MSNIVVCQLLGCHPSTSRALSADAVLRGSALDKNSSLGEQGQERSSALLSTAPAARLGVIHSFR